jgi:hypothetical protein
VLWSRSCKEPKLSVRSQSRSSTEVPVPAPGSGSETGVPCTLIFVYHEDVILIKLSIANFIDNFNKMSIISQ